MRSISQRYHLYKIKYIEALNCLTTQKSYIDAIIPMIGHLVMLYFVDMTNL